MNQEELIARMRGRVALCRRLAILTTDHHTADALIAMANEGETDVERLLAATAEKATGEPFSLVPSTGRAWNEYSTSN